ncbi:MAG: hypothetical protein ACKOZT_11990 [Cyanobium sp.]
MSGSHALLFAQTANTDLCQLVAAAADLCRKPLRHGVRIQGQPTAEDCCLVLEVRDALGQRLGDQDLEVELYMSGEVSRATLHLTIAWLGDPDQPMLWQGQHPVWMDAQGQRCGCPPDGMALEALARRLAALLAPGSAPRPDR